MRQIEQLRKDGKLVDAIAACSKLVEEARPGQSQAEALLERAVLNSEAGDYIGALRDARFAETYTSNVGLCYQLQGECLLGLGSYPQALEELSRALQLEPGDPGVLVDRALAYSRLGFYDLAEADVSAAIEISPKEGQYYWRRGVFCFERGDYRASASDFLQAIALNPKLVDCYRQYGVAEYFLGNEQVASNYFSQYALQAGTNVWFRYGSLGSCYGMAGEHKRAIQYYDDAVRLNPNCQDCYSDRALMKYFDGQYDGALSDISKEMHIGSPDAQDYKLLGVLDLIRSSYGAAHEKFKENIALSPTTEDGRIGLIAACLLSGQKDEAFAELQRASDQGVWRTRLWLWSRLLGVETSKGYDEYVLQFSPHSWPHALTRYYLGQIGVDDVLKSASHPNPVVQRRNLVEAHFFIAALMALNGDRSGATNEFAQAVKADTILSPLSVLAQRQSAADWRAILDRRKPN